MKAINTITESQARQLFSNYCELSERSSTFESFESFEQWCESNNVVIESGEALAVTRIKNDINGNPRYVVHFYALLGDADADNRSYALALSRARAFGGRKFNNKQFGGGIVFQSYSLDELMDFISRASGRNFTRYEVNK